MRGLPSIDRAGPLTRSMLRHREATLSHKGRGEASDAVSASLASHGVIETGEKSTNQLFGCTKPLTFGLMARGATSWAT